MLVGFRVKLAMCATLRVHMAKAFLLMLATFISVVFIIEQLTVLHRQEREAQVMSQKQAQVMSDPDKNKAKPDEGNLEALEYEVFGKVQGVFFRKNTEDKAKELGVRGWIMNTKVKTVKGELEGDSEKVAKMKEWLEKIGSPKSKIDKAVFSNQRKIDSFSFNKFTRRH